MSTISELESKLDAATQLLAQMQSIITQMKKKASKKAKKASETVLPASEDDTEVTTEATTEEPKQRKRNAYVEFTIRLGGSKTTGEAGVLADGGVSMKAIIQKQFAGSLGDSWLKANNPENKKDMKVDWVALSESYADIDLIAAAKVYEPPEQSKQSVAKSDAESATGSEKKTRKKKVTSE